MPRTSDGALPADPHDPQTVRAMFGRLAARYDVLNRLLSGGLDVLWRRRLVRAAGTEKGGVYLDLASGTMDVALGLRKRYPRGLFLCLDISRPMLEAGRRKARRAGETAALQAVQGDAFALPVRARSIDVTTVAFGVRNMAPRRRAFEEIFRALKPGGRLAILEFGSAARPVWFGLYNVYLTRFVPFVGRLVGKNRAAYTYLAETIRRFPTAKELDAELLEAGFRHVRHESLCGGIVWLHVAQKGAGGEECERGV